MITAVVVSSPDEGGENKYLFSEWKLDADKYYLYDSGINAIKEISEKKCYVWAKDIIDLPVKIDSYAALCNNNVFVIKKDAEKLNGGTEKVNYNKLSELLKRNHTTDIKDKEIEDAGLVQGKLLSVDNEGKNITLKTYEVLNHYTDLVKKNNDGRQFVCMSENKQLLIFTEEKVGDLLMSMDKLQSENMMVESHRNKLDASTKTVCQLEEKIKALILSGGN